jgi:hypothetical protein
MFKRRLALVFLSLFFLALGESANNRPSVLGALKFAQPAFSNVALEELISELDYHLGEIQPPLNPRPALLSEANAKFHKDEIIKLTRKLSDMVQARPALFLTVRANLNYILPETKSGTLIVHPWSSDDVKDSNMDRIRIAIIDAVLRFEKKNCDQKLY